VTPKEKAAAAKAEKAAEKAAKKAAAAEAKAAADAAKKEAAAAKAAEEAAKKAAADAAKKEAAEAKAAEEAAAKAAAAEAKAAADAAKKEAAEAKAAEEAAAKAAAAEAKAAADAAKKETAAAKAAEEAAAVTKIAAMQRGKKARQALAGGEGAGAGDAAAAEEAAKAAEEAAAKAAADAAAAARPWTEAVLPDVVVVRKEIRKMPIDEQERYAAALMKMRENVDGPGTSPFFRLALMHGGMPPLSKAEAPEYCSHRRENFPHWHRPYLLDFEAMLRRADLALGRDGNLGLPYWDWSELEVNGEVFPRIVRERCMSEFPPDFFSVAPHPGRHGYSMAATKSDADIRAGLLRSRIAEDAAKCLLPANHAQHATTRFTRRTRHVSIETPHNKVRTPTPRTRSARVTCCCCLCVHASLTVYLFPPLTVYLFPLRALCICSRFSLCVCSRFSLCVACALVTVWCCCRCTGSSAASCSPSSRPSTQSSGCTTTTSIASSRATCARTPTPPPSLRRTSGASSGAVGRTASRASPTGRGARTRPFCTRRRARPSTRATPSTAAGWASTMTRCPRRGPRRCVSRHSLPSSRRST